MIVAKHKGAGRRPRHGVTGGMRSNMAARDATEEVLRKRMQESPAARMSQTKPEDPQPKPKPEAGPAKPQSGPKGE